MPMARTSRATAAGPAPTVDTQLSGIESFQSLFEALQVGVMVNGPNGEILFMNAAGLEMFGVTKEQIAGKKTRDVNYVTLREDGSECPPLMRPVARAIRTKKPVVGEVLGWHRLGSEEILWTLVTAVPQFADTGELRDVITTLTDITDRKNTEAALRRAAELNRQILLSAQEGIIVHDRQLRYVLWNPYMERMSGVKESEIVGKHPLEVFPFMAASGMHADLERALAGETISSHDAYFTVPHTQRAGWCNNNFAPLRDAQGEIIGVVATVRDVTERKRTEVRLRESETLLAQAEQLANMGSWELDVETQMLQWSAQYYRLLGQEPESGPLQYCEGINLIHPDDLERATRDMNLLISTGQPLDNELRVVRADGSVRIIHSRAVAITNDAGRVVRIQGMSQDVTERKNEEKQLRKSEALLSHAEQIADFGSWETDLNTGRSTLSKNLLQMYGLDFEEQWDRETFWERVHPEDRTRARSIIEKAIAECKPFEFVVRYRSREGTYRVHFNRAIQIPGPEGKAERSIGVSHDITEQVRAEEELRQLSSRLLQLQDQERKRIARDLHDSVSQKLLTINLNLAQFAKSDDVRTKHARQILADTRRTVRDLSKEIRSLSYLLHPPLLDELGLASAIEEYAKGFSQRSGIELTFEMPSDAGRLPKESETALFRIVQEALANIQKHSGSTRGGIRLAREGNEVVLEIADEGRGMPSEDVTKRPTGSRTLGVGILGMRERMRQLSGRLEITSGDRGTTVKAVLPLIGDEKNAGSHSTGG